MGYLFSGKSFFYRRKHRGVYEKKSLSGTVQKGEANIETVLENKYLTMSFDSRSGVLYQEWKGFCPGAEFRALIDSVFVFMIEKKIYKTICDVRYQRVVPPSCQKYVEEKSLGFISNYGIFFTAFVALEKSAGGVCARLYDINITRKLNHRINSFFYSIIEAESWLSEK